jgi:hypothetical protein
MVKAARRSLAAGPVEPVGRNGSDPTALAGPGSLLERIVRWGRSGNAPVVIRPVGAGAGAGGVSYFSRTVTVEPEDALEILENHRFYKQRDPSAVYVTLYSTEMESGEWSVSEMAVFAFAEDGIIQLANGNHRMIASMQTETPMIVNFTVFLDITREQAEIEYNRMDRNRVRELHDCVSLEELQALSETEYRIKRHDVKPLETAARYIQSDFQVDQFNLLAVRYRQLNYQKQKLQEWAAPFALYRLATQERGSALRTKVLDRTVVGPAMVILVEQPERGSEFFRRTFKGEGLSAESPEYRLRDYMLSDRWKADKADVRARKVIRAWNAFWDKRTVSSLMGDQVETLRPVIMGSQKYGRR